MLGGGRGAWRGDVAGRGGGALVDGGGRGDGDDESDPAAVSADASMRSVGGGRDWG